jgi:hypothetical protein
MAGKYGSPSVTVTLDDSGGTPRVITGHVLTMGGAKITANMMPSHTFGDAWEEHTPTGLQKGEDMTLEGFWDTTATTGPHAVFGTLDSSPQGTTRTLVIVFGDSKTVTMEVRQVDYEVLAVVGELTKFRALLRPTGAVTWS